MSDITPFTPDTKSKSFWKRPEGVTGLVFLIALVAGGGFLLFTFLPALIALAQNTLYLVGMLLVLALIVYMIVDPKMRGLIGYMYKSIMRGITSLFVTLDPIGILKNYVEDLQNNLSKMSKQIGNLRGQMRKIKDMITGNAKDLDQNLKIAKKAKELGNQKQMMLASRKAARLKETNEKYAKLHKKMEVLNRVLNKMYQNSEILLEDTKDQVKLKEQERKAIRTSHSAMKSAMSVLSGDKDKRAMFDQALEVIADDVANKVGEMERFMELSANFMDSVDLQNGIFEEEGLKMLEQYEQESTLLFLGGGKVEGGLDLNAPRKSHSIESKTEEDSDYENLFE